MPVEYTYLRSENATPVPIMPRSHKLQKSVSVQSVSRIEIDSETTNALPKGHGRKVSRKPSDSVADHRVTYDRRGRPRL